MAHKDNKNVTNCNLRVKFSIEEPRREEPHYYWNLKEWSSASRISGPVRHVFIGSRMSGDDDGDDDDEGNGAYDSCDLLRQVVDVYSVGIQIFCQPVPSVACDVTVRYI